MWEVGDHAVEEVDEPVEPDGLHLFALDGGVVLVEFAQEDLRM